MDITEKILQKKREAVCYSSKFNNNNAFFVMANYKNAILTNSTIAVDELKNNGYSVISTFVNGKEIQ